MKLSISHLRQIIVEEIEAELLEKKKEPSLSKEKEVAKKQKKLTAKDGAKFVDAPKKFSPKASPEQAGGTIHNCAKQVTDQDRRKSGKSLEADMTKKEQSKAYPICTKTAAVAGATGKKSKGYKKGSECARVGGKTPEKCPS